MADVTDQARARWRERMENPDKPTPGWPLKVNDNREKGAKISRLRVAK